MFSQFLHMASMKNTVIACKPAKSAPKHISQSLTGSTMLSVCEGTIIASLVLTTKKQKTTQKIMKKKKNESKSIPPKSKAALWIEERVVAKGITLSGDILHGHALVTLGVHKSYD